MTEYNTDHLDDREVKAVANAIWQEIMAELSEAATDDGHGILHTADLDDLFEEHRWWTRQYEQRLGYVAPTEDD